MLVKAAAYINPLTLFALYVCYIAVHVSQESELFSDIAAAWYIFFLAFPAILINIIINHTVKRFSRRIVLNIIIATILLMLLLKYT